VRHIRFVLFGASDFAVHERVLETLGESGAQDSPG